MAHPIVITEEATARFWASVTPGDEETCWLWTGNLSHNGYGVFNIRRPRVIYRAHRYSLVLHTGEQILDGLQACHRCNVRRCVNPAHLYAGTAADNTADAYRAGTHNLISTGFCKRGHELPGTPSRSRRCLICRAAYNRLPERVAAKRTATNAAYRRANVAPAAASPILSAFLMGAFA